MSLSVCLRYLCVEVDVYVHSYKWNYEHPMQEGVRVHVHPCVRLCVACVCIHESDL